ICHETRECDIFRNCHYDQYCDDIPKVVQVLKDSQYSSGFTLEIMAAEGVPERVISDLENKSVSRLMMSLFLETARMQAGEITRVVLGDLNRKNSGTYNDKVSLDEIVQESIADSAEIPSLSSFAAKELKIIYPR